MTKAIGSETSGAIDGTPNALLIIPGCAKREPGISRFRAWSFGPSRNDGVDQRRGWPGRSAAMTTRKSQCERPLQSHMLIHRPPANDGPHHAPGKPRLVERCVLALRFQL